MKPWDRGTAAEYKAVDSSYSIPMDLKAMGSEAMDGVDDVAVGLAGVTGVTGVTEQKSAAEARCLAAKPWIGGRDGA